MHKFISTLILLFAFLTLKVHSHGNADQDAKELSIINLIATPQAFDNNKIRIFGVVNLEFEGNKICLDKASYEHWISKNCLWIDLNYKKLKTDFEHLKSYNGKYVLLEGTFKQNRYGHMGANSGSVLNVTRYQLVEESTANK